jgi:uncharacterized repeat protein (TIGR02543 family)
MLKVLLFRTNTKRRQKQKMRKLFYTLALFAVPLLLPAQTPIIVGYPANFDTYNNTGSNVYGFEMEVDGIQPGDVTRVFPSNFPVAPGQPCVIRYCVGTVTPFAGGVYVRWAGQFDPNTQQWSLSTPPANGTVASGESCWTMALGARYPTAGCEHFGISTTRMWTNIVYHWLVPDPNNPGQLVYYSGNTVPLPGAPPPPPIPVILPQPFVNVIPPAQIGAAPAIAFEIQAPPPPPQPVPQYGTAQWVKVFKLEQDNEVDLNDLMGGNPAVPENAAQVETGWKLMQYDPTPHGKGNVLHNQQLLGNGHHAVVRRYEHYTYTGAYDPITHEALCLDGTCSAPGPGELGDIVGAQNAAVNIEMPSLQVTKVGSGSVSGAGGAISCGNTCFANLPAGASESLSANPPSNAVFNGWSGACAGTGTCGFTVTGAMNVTATFTTVYTLSVSRSGNGSIAGTPNGEFSTLIDCGRSCSAKFQNGKMVTLTATPAAGVTFTGWTGACSGTVPTCNVTIAADTKVQANFK